jgi:hypothetical protein
MIYNLVRGCVKQGIIPFLIAGFILTAWSPSTKNRTDATTLFLPFAPQNTD